MQNAVAVFLGLIADPQEECLTLSMTLILEFVKPYARRIKTDTLQDPGVLTEEIECGQYPTDAEIYY